MNNRQAWFSVDPSGLSELHSSFPLDRMVFELMANAWDEGVSRCDITMQECVEFNGAPASKLVVEDNSPRGFRDMKDAFTLFRSSEKRRDAEKRGRFNYGEKLVISRSLWAKVSSTTGVVLFDEQGRHVLPAERSVGTRVEVIFPPWDAGEMQKAIERIRLVIPPTATPTFLNGEQLVAREAETVAQAILPTELLVNEGSTSRIRPTRRKTSIGYYRVNGRKAMLFEMGVPVVEIPGVYDMDVGQKVPVSTDRQTVAVGFLQDLMAEAVLALGDKIRADEVGMSVLQLALEDSRIEPAKAKEVFHSVFGQNAVLQSHRPDEDQEAARQGMTIVSPRALGAEVNAKLREAGVATTHQLFSRSSEVSTGDMIEDVDPATYTPAQRRFLEYARMLAKELYGLEKTFSVGFAKWKERQTAAVNVHRTSVKFHPARVAVDSPVTGGTAIILHELAHCCGDGHDGVYDHEFERLVNRHTALLASKPELYQPFL